MFNIIISGPTASGKTEVAVKLAKLVNGEIISSDSRQIYKYLDIGTNKSGNWDQNKKARIVHDIPQYLTDIIEPSQTFSAGDFRNLAEQFIKKISSQKKIPIIVGGTGLYIKALVDGLAPLPEKDPKIRNELAKELKNFGAEHLYNKLKPIDFQAALKNKKNPQRLIRALEVYYITGTPITELHKKTVPSKRKFVQFGLLWPREELYNNIEKRTSQMINSGMIDETKKVINMGYNPFCPGLQSIGYRHIIEYLNNKINYDNLKVLIKRDTCHYAKRQTTWFKKDKRIKWIQIKQKDYNPDIIADKILKNITNLL